MTERSQQSVSPASSKEREITAAQTVSHSTLQLSGIVLTVTADLSFSVREYRGETVYIIEDEVKSRFYRIGLAEYTFVSLLDGRRSFAEALGQTASLMKDQAFSESDAAALCRWLVETGLASTPASRSSARLFESTQQTQRSKIQQTTNPMFLKIPLCQPDRLMKASAAVLGWVFSGPAVLLWLVVVAAGVFCVAMNQATAATMTTNIVSQFNWLSLLMTAIGLKLVHEMAHGTACRRFGCHVREAGVMTILFVPLPYVDVTSAWRLESRWQRILISAAGMYAEFFIAAIAAFVWASATPGIVQQHAFNVMFSASVVSLLFNANPLMKFDGYHILADFLEQPNLATHGQLCLRSFGRRLCFALPGHSADWPEGRTWFVVLYGVAAFVWRIAICVGMILAADAMFFGAGAILAAIAILTWVVLPAIRLTLFTVRGNGTEQPSRRRAALVSMASVALVVVVANFRWQERVEAPAVVDFDRVVEVRTAVSGFVDHTAVVDGAAVQTDTLLLQLVNPELEIQRRQLADRLSQSEQRRRQLYHRREIAAWQVEVSSGDSLRDQLSQLDERLEKLTLRAPVEGLIVDGDVTSLIGTYVAAGTRVLSIGPSDSRKVLAVVPEEAADVFRAQAGQRVSVHIWGTGKRTFSGELEPPAPRGTTQVPHPAFAATAGGPVDVHMQQASGRDSDSTIAFVRPHFLTRVNVDDNTIARLQAGRTGFVHFDADRGTVGDVAADAAARWWYRRQLALRQSTFR